VLGAGSDPLKHARQTLAEMLKVSISDAKFQHFINNRRKGGK
jgi:hypothetical protein